MMYAKRIRAALSRYRPTGIAVLAGVVLPVAACTVDLDFHVLGAGGSTGTPVCTPAAVQPCYDGPAGTEGQGLCKAGTQTCAADGMSWGSCTGAVLPQPENCATPEDEDCDGLAPACKGNLLWANRYGDAGDQYGQSMAIDSAGNVVLTGYFSGAVDFGGGPLQAGGVDVFVAKLDASGNHLWSKSFGDASHQAAQSVAVDSTGNVLLTGNFTGKLDFGGGPLTATSPGGDLFVAKLDPNGSHLWSKSFASVNSQVGQRIAVDSAGSVLLAGNFSGTLDLGGVPLQAENVDLFVAKLDANGAHLWSKRFGSDDTSLQFGQGIAADPSGNVLLTGYFHGAMDCGGGPLVSTGNYDAFVAKLDASGAHVWSKSFGSADDVVGASVTTDGGGNVLLTGTFGGTLDFGGGPQPSAGGLDIFVAKLDASGAHVWSKTFGTTGYDVGASVATDSGGNVLLTGTFGGTLDFGGGPQPSAGGLDIFVVKLDATGAHVWSKGLGGTQDEGGIAIGGDAAGNVNVLAMGLTGGAVNFGGGLPPLVSAGGADIFLAKFGP